MSQTGVLLLNLGTPDAPDARSVRRYLRQFLSDPYVIDIPAPLRWLLLRLVILPFRSKSSSALYQSIWTDQGSPLLLNSRALEAAVSQAVGDSHVVVLGMRYGNPSIEKAVEHLVEHGCEQCVVLPLFPQYSLAATASAVDCALASLREHGYPRDAIRVIDDFFRHPDFIASWVAVSRTRLSDFQPDHVLMSYHGLPERQITKAGCSPDFCQRQESCPPVESANQKCYRAQAYATSQALAEKLQLPSYSVAFQSRLGRIPWIRPYTDEVLPQLAEQGVKKLAVMCPSFVADCLETLEEIDIRAREQWKDLGGTDFQFIPCLNAHPRWVNAVVSMFS